MLREPSTDWAVGISKRTLASLAIIVAMLGLWTHSVKADDIGDVARQLIEPITGSHKIAIQPLDHSKAGIPASAASSFIERLTNAIQNSLSGSNLSLVERSKLAQIMQEQEEFKSTEEFSKLLANAGADILVVSSATRLGGGKIEFSARAIGAAGAQAGEGLSASKSITVDAPTEYSVAVVGVMFKGKAKPAYQDSLIAGLTKVSEMRITKRDDIFSKDFQVSSEIEYLITDKETAESTEAKKTQSIMGSMSKSFGGGSGGGNNPIANMMKSIGGSTNPDDLKLKAISATVITKLERIGEGSIIIAEAAAKEDVPFNAEKLEISRVLKSLIRKLLHDTGEEVALLALGRNVPKKKEGDLLD